ncbi:alpha/beta hydrolase [Amycolatopsis sp. K13G38]|uniref:Alpha/beta hydrolase n=1 Tax=Amycolatopsis acididurans TaxID=2724524 RepID=A0ABX1J3Y6_9PSEU|nr:alpha/beta hydrolase [Amycolatopsis acididurans]NKQ54507.1 alpha/beta hydrolase [Amycolatopsis acididurans]
MRETFRGVRFYVHGERGPWVVFSHATGADHDSFRPQVEMLAGRGWRVLTWDAPGHGASPRTAGAFEIGELADLLAALIRHVAGGPVMLVGHSLGGYLSQHVVLRHPGLVRGLAGLGCTSVTLPPPRRQIAVLRLSGLLLQVCPPPLRRTLIARTGRARPPTRRYLRRAVTRSSSAGLARAWRAVTRSLRDRPDLRLPCPLLVAHGEYDRTGIIAAAAPLWAEHQRGGFEIIPEAGHYANLDNPAYVNDMLSRFLDAAAQAC